MFPVLLSTTGPAAATARTHSTAQITLMSIITVGIYYCDKNYWMVPIKTYYMTVVAKRMKISEEVVRFYIQPIVDGNVCRMDQFSTGIRVIRFVSPSCDSSRGSCLLGLRCSAAAGRSAVRILTLTVKFLLLVAARRILVNE